MPEPKTQAELIATIHCVEDPNRAHFALNRTLCGVDCSGNWFEEQTFLETPGLRNTTHCYKCYVILKRRRDSHVNENLTLSEWNKAVAMSLGMTLNQDKTGFRWSEYGFGAFEPATDPAAALWALKRLCHQYQWEYQIIGRWHQHKWQTKITHWTGTVECKISRSAGLVFIGISGFGDDCEAMCRAIVGAANTELAAERRNDARTA